MLLDHMSIDIRRQANLAVLGRPPSNNYQEGINRALKSTRNPNVKRSVLENLKKDEQSHYAVLTDLLLSFMKHPNAPYKLAPGFQSLNLEKIRNTFRVSALFTLLSLHIPHSHSKNCLQAWPLTCKSIARTSSCGWINVFQVCLRTAII